MGATIPAFPMATAPILNPVPVARPLAFSNLNLNVPAAIPAGFATGADVQTYNVQGLGRQVITNTPQITEVRPQLKITEKIVDVPVPKPVYETKQVTPIHHQYVAEPYTVEQPYIVPQPYAVPTPVNVPVAVPQRVHVQHNVIARPAITYASSAPTVAAVHQVAASPAVQTLSAAVPYSAGVQHVATFPAVYNIAAAPALTHAVVQRVEVDDD
ncbi:hypothetical protein SK128_001090 [Halocaridina rubra]|uniref:Uncharacterized protein n=1 Tax=Halocaridina rubra TaxID=373956 RepID=A0AAN9A7P5_HALRR